MQAVAYLQHFFTARKLKDTEKSAKKIAPDPILLEISDVTQKLQNINNRFNFEIDEDMIEACIYEQQALLSRYRHLLTLARQKGLCQSPVNKYLSEKMQTA